LSDCPGYLEIDNASNDAQQVNAHFDRDNPILAVERTGMVGGVAGTGRAIYHFGYKPFLSSTHRFYAQISQGSLSSFAGIKQPAKMRGFYSVEVVDDGAAVPLTAVSGGYAILITAQSIKRSRTNNVARLKIGSSHGIPQGRTARVLSVGGGSGYSATRVVANVPDPTIFEYANVGLDEAETDDVGTFVMAIENVFSQSVLIDPSTDTQSVSKLGDFYRVQFLVPAASIAAGASTSFTVSIPGARVGDAVKVDFAGLLPDGIYDRSAVTSDATITVRLRNVSAATIAQPAMLGHAELLRT
jgi:hypothetical protein